jgi:peptidoglycan L-alanyl-D-glutamate endopeptidase CwlK
MNSLHLKRCAIDLNFFKDGKLIYDIKQLQIVGNYWESLHEKNEWGGNWKSFKDVPHFQRG